MHLYAPHRWSLVISNFHDFVSLPAMHFLSIDKLLSHTHILVQRAAGTHHLNFVSILNFKIFINKCTIKYACGACICVVAFVGVVVVIVAVVMCFFHSKRMKKTRIKKKKLGKYMHILYAYIEPHTNAIYMQYNISTRCTHLLFILLHTGLMTQR